ncbi:MAG TPA: TonB-dependent receptor [Ohtaekwangia sp.]|nr:TonB-dependent receptor [Ohtaekwangia sp.]
MKSIYLIFSAILILQISALAQTTGSIKGTVKTADGNPAEYVNISIEGSSKGSVAGRKGNFEIRNLAPGAYVVVASFVGLETQKQSVQVTAGQTVTIDFTLNENSDQLEEIVISGERDQYTTDRASSSLRLSSTLMETPQNIQVLTNDVLKDQQVISMSDGLIRNVSGAVRQEHWGDLYANIMARGSQIQAFRNGFNVVNSYWGPLTEDMSFVDHIEFVKGPAGFMLSSGDPSGLYNVVTKKPTGVPGGEVSITTGSFGLWRSTLDLDGKLSKDGTLLYRLNLSAQNKNSFRPNEYNDRYVIAPVVSYQLDDETKVTLEYNYQRANMSNVGSYYVFAKDGFASLPVDHTALPAGSPGTEIDDHSIYLNIQHDISSKWKVTGQVAMFRYDQIGHSMWPGVANQDGTYVRNISIWDAKSDMTMTQLFINGEIQTGKIRHRILSGFDMATKDYMADWGQAHELEPVDNPFNPNDPNLGVPINGFPRFDRVTSLEERAQIIGGLQDQRYTSFYFQDELGFFDNQIRLTVAGRYTDLQQSYAGVTDEAKHFTPRVGLSASINKQLAVYALYDQAFIPQTGILANGAKVQPITGNNIELGIKKDWDGGWNTTIAIYRIIKNNELTSDPNDSENVLSIELGQKRAQGIEFDLRGTIVTGLNLITNYAYTDSRVIRVSEGVNFPEEGSIVPGFAKHTFNTWLTYKLQRGVLKGLGVSAGLTYLTDRATYWEASPDPDKEMEDYVKLDAGLFWEKDKIKVTVNVFNVLDEYLYSGSYEGWMTDAEGDSSPMYSYQAEAPRNARISLAYRF